MRTILSVILTCIEKSDGVRVVTAAKHTLKQLLPKTQLPGVRETLWDESFISRWVGWGVHSGWGSGEGVGNVFSDVKGESNINSGRTWGNGSFRPLSRAPCFAPESFRPSLRKSFRPPTLSRFAHYLMSRSTHFLNLYSIEDIVINLQFLFPSMKILVIFL